MLPPQPECKPTPPAVPRPPARRSPEPDNPEPAIQVRSTVLSRNDVECELRLGAIAKPRLSPGSGKLQPNGSASRIACSRGHFGDALILTPMPGPCGSPRTR